MFARVTRFQASEDAVEGARRFRREAVVPRAREMEGFRGFLALSDPETGTLIGISLWASEEAMRRSESNAGRLRDEAAEHSHGRVVSVERFEAELFDL